MVKDDNILNDRLDERVDIMLEKGLIEELLQFHSSCNAPLLKENENGSNEEHYTKGIFQSIGLKEFHEYLLLDADQRSSQLGDKLLKKGIEAMKLKVPVYELNGSDLDEWATNVREPAIEIVESKLKGITPPFKPVKIEPTDNNRETGDKTRYYCEVCERIFIGVHQWEIHLKSNKHRTVLKKLRNKKTKEIPPTYQLDIENDNLVKKTKI